MPSFSSCVRSASVMVEAAQLRDEASSPSSSASAASPSSEGWAFFSASMEVAAELVAAAARDADASAVLDPLMARSCSSVAADAAVVAAPAVASELSMGGCAGGGGGGARRSSEGMGARRTMNREMNPMEKISSPFMGAVRRD